METYGSLMVFSDDRPSRGQLSVSVALVPLLWALTAIFPAMVMAVDFPAIVVPDRGILSIPRPGEERLPPPEFEPEEAVPSIETPAVEPRAPGERRLVYQPRVILKAIRVEDATVLSPQEIEEIKKKYIGRPITTIDLQQLRYELTLLYIKKGYITSGVVIPDQGIVDDSIYLQAIEGNLSKINVSNIDDSGQRRLRDRYLTDRIRLAAEPVLNVVTLRDRLQILNQGPLLDQVKAQLRPDAELGQAILDLKVEEAVPYRLDLTVDNFRPPSIGALEGTIHAAHLNLTGWGDALNVFYSHTEGLGEFTGAYSIPITAHDTTLSLSYQTSKSNVLEEPFSEIDVESEYDGWGVGVR